MRKKEKKKRWERKKTKETRKEEKKQKQRREKKKMSLLVWPFLKELDYLQWTSELTKNKKLRVNKFQTTKRQKEEGNNQKRKEFFSFS